jgi:hypothetical protein
MRGNMKYRSIHKLRLEIQSLRHKGKTWREICEQLNILTEQGKPNTGLAEDIGYRTVIIHGKEEAYAPADPAVRERLHLAPVCQECKRPIHRRNHDRNDNPEPLPEFMQWWRNRKPEEKREYIRILYSKYR